MPKAELEQSISPQLREQRDLTLMQLRQYRDSLNVVIEKLEKAQTIEEYMALVREAAHSIKV